MGEEGRVQEKGKGSGGSQRKQPLGKERGGLGEGERREREGDTHNPSPPLPKNFGGMALGSKVAQGLNLT